ncbi:MAG: hypothetical protein II648_01145 [Bacteroidales bacterium]|nr:hypothetical protein [Bacteroidales bacterium]
MRVKILIMTALLAAVAVSCGRKLPEPSIGWPAQRAIDALVGEYVADTLMWDGPEVNLAEIEKKLAEQHSFTVYVYRDDISNGNGYFYIPVVCSVRYSQYPQIGHVSVRFKAEKDGTLSFETMDSYIQGGRLEEPEITFAEGRLTLSYMTEVLVMPGREYIEGRMTSVWRCISSKEREQ